MNTDQVYNGLNGLNGLNGRQSDSGSQGGLPSATRMAPGSLSRMGLSINSLKVKAPRQQSLSPHMRRGERVG